MKTDEEIGLGTAATAVQQQQQINKPAASSSRTLASILSKKSSFARPMTPSVIITDETITSPHLQQQPSSPSCETTPIISLDVSVNGQVPSMMDSIVVASADDGQRSPCNNPPACTGHPLDEEQCRNPVAIRNASAGIVKKRTRSNAALAINNSSSSSTMGESSPNSRINSATSAMSAVRGGAASANPTATGATVEENSSKLAVLRRRCCSETVRSVIWGLLIMSSVSVAWLGSNHMLKSTFQTVHYYNHSSSSSSSSNSTSSTTDNNNASSSTRPPPPPLLSQHLSMSSTSLVKSSNRGSASDNLYRLTFQNIDDKNDDDDDDDEGGGGGRVGSRYKSTFLNTWTVSTWNLLYLPLYVLGSLVTGRPGPRRQLVTDLRESLLAFRDKGFTRGTFMGRCCLLCLLWVGTNWMYMYALSVLDATDVMALFATNLSFVYLLSWVVLHIQFVGLRIVAVIFCNTGIALLAYMDGIAGRSPTLGGVVLAAAASAGSAVYKVSFKKIFGDATYGQISFFCSLIGLFNLVLLWPLLLTLHFSGAETVDWARIPWTQLAAAGALSLVTNLLSNFGPGLTYETYIHLGVVAAIPISAVLDMEYNGTVFEGMKLAGTVMIVSGFLLVLLPSNWTDYIARFLTWGRNWNQNSQLVMTTPAVDLRTGYISRSHLRTPSGRVK